MLMSKYKITMKSYFRSFDTTQGVISNLYRKKKSFPQPSEGSRQGQKIKLTMTDSQEKSTQMYLRSFM